LDKPNILGLGVAGLIAMVFVTTAAAGLYRSTSWQPLSKLAVQKPLLWNLKAWIPRERRTCNFSGGFRT